MLVVCGLIDAASSMTIENVLDAIDGIGTPCYIRAMSDENTIGTGPVDLKLELEVMGTLAEALGKLESGARSRVLEWAISSFGVQLARGGQQPDKRGSGDATARTTQSPARDQSQGGFDSFEDLPSLFAAVDPKTDIERALVAAAWHQVQSGGGDWASQPINTELKHLGHKVGNITDALSSLMARKPALVIQTRKEGSSRQARKKYKVTHEGFRHIDRLLANDVGDDQ